MKLRLASVVFMMAALLVSCATLLGQHEVDIPLARLQESVSKRFPFNDRYLELLDIRLSNPRVTLQPESNRILTSMDTSISPPFFNKAWNGNFAISGQLRIDAARQALVLSDPRVETFHVNGLDPVFSSQIGKIGKLIAEELLRDMPLYTFRPDELKYAGTTFFPTKITTRPSGLVVTFEPAR